MRNIEKVTDNALCTGCGACQGVCASEAVSIHPNSAGFLLARVDNVKCTSCRLCSKICPSNSENTPVIRKQDIFHGNYLRGYVGHAVNNSIRQKSQSGGIVTSLLCYLIERGLIDGAVVNKYDVKNNRPQAVFASTINEIVKGKGSYYSQSAVVKTVLENKGKKIAAVTLGCQTESLMNIEKHSMAALPSYIIGLFCLSQYSGKFIDELIVKSGCNKNDVTDFRFRDKDAGGWPGHIKIYTGNESYVLNHKVRHRLKKVYENYRCLLCFDQLNIFSDISVGDPWGIENYNNSKGNTVIIVRTEKGLALIADAVKDKIISVNEIPVKQIIDGQTVDGRLKTQFFTAMQNSKKRGHLYPYDEKKFNEIIYQKPLMRNKWEIQQQLDYCRRLYLKQDIRQANRLIYFKKLQLMGVRLYRKTKKIQIKLVRVFKLIFKKIV